MRIGELDLDDPEQIPPLRLIADTLGKCPLCILLPQEDVNCLDVADLDERPRPHDGSSR